MVPERGKGPIGIVIQVERQDYSSLPPDLVRSLRLHQQEAFKYTIRIGRRADKAENDLFLWHPIAEELVAKKVPLGATIGTANLFVFKDKKEIEWETFYPFENLEDDYNIALRKTGLGSLIQWAITSKLAKRFPNFRVRHSTRKEAEFLTNERRGQLKRFGLDPKRVSSKGYSMGVYRKRMRAYLKGMFKRFPIRRTRPGK